MPDVSTAKSDTFRCGSLRFKKNRDSSLRAENPENRIADHRINFKAHNLDQVLDGDLDPLLDALAAADKQSRLQEA